jgi:hypothetical protein
MPIFAQTLINGDFLLPIFFKPCCFGKLYFYKLFRNSFFWQMLLLLLRKRLITINNFVQIAKEGERKV